MDQITGADLTPFSQAFVIWDKDQQLVSWSPSCLEYWYNPADILRPGMPMLELLNHLAAHGAFGEGKPEVLARREFERVNALGFEAPDEFTMLDGRVIRIQRSVMNDGGHASIYTDVTEDMQSDRALLRSDEFLRYIIDQIPDVFVLKDDKGDFLLCNEVVAKLYNTTPEQMVGKHDDDFGVPKEMADYFRRNVLSVMESGKTEVVYEDSQDVNTGEIRNFKSIKKPFIGPDGKKRVIIIAQDITELITIQNQLKKDEATLQGVLEIIKEGVWSWHIPSGTVTHNDEWYRLLGAERGDIAETMEAFSEHLHPDDIADVMANVDKHMSGEADLYESEHRMVRVDGSVIMVYDRGRIIERDEDGAPVRMIGSVRDITELKRTVEEMHHAKVDAETANKAKSEFLASMSHELRTPMNAILGFAQMLGYMSKTPLTNAQLEYVNSIETAGEHLLQLINQILDLAKIEADELDLNVEEHSLQHIVKDAVGLLQPLADERNITLAFVNESDCQDNVIHTDKLRLKQCILNIISNAIKYNHPAGSVSVECTKSSDKIRLSVTDTGVGIPLEEHNDIFTMFYRLDVHSMKAKEGTGIGLNVTKLLIEKLGGSIGFQSEVGKGSVFWIEHPIMPGQ